jgi:hypothetical protein
MKPQISGIIRHILTFAGGIIVAKGLVSETLAVELVGSLSGIIGLVWSVLSKKK